MAFVTTRILFWSAVAMMAILVFMRVLPHDHFLWIGINPEIPFIPVLVVAPIGMVVCAWMIKRGSAFPFCVDCKLRYDTPAERGFLGMIYSEEGKSQIRILLFGMILLSVSAWLYYLLKYINESFTAADRYYFFGIPAALWVISALYISARYFGIYRYYRQDIQGSYLRKGPSTKVRFIIVHDNKFLIRIPNADAVVDLMRTKADTPAEIVLPFRQNLPLFEAESYLEGILPLKKPKVRFLYSNKEWNADCNIFHYLVKVDDDEAALLSEKIEGSMWVTIHRYSELLHVGNIDSLLASEIHRIYTTVMAFKTYDEHGRRLYPIKHYRPTFRLSEVFDSKVDFTQRKWLYIAHCNQDQPLYRLRSLWRRHISGLSY